MLTVAVLMTCHDRRAQTVACIRSLVASMRHAPEVRFRVFLVDDGSTDGTAAAVERLGAPLTLITGDGSLFWNRGMVLAWQTAAGDANGYDGYLLLNDDTFLDPHAIDVLLSVSAEHADEAIIVGAVRDPISGELTYGGLARVSSWHPGRVALKRSSPAPQLADTFHGNCAYVPRAVFECLGPLDPRFHHGMGDFDYGFRARSVGIRVVIAPETVAACSRNRVTGTWQDASLPLKRRLSLLNSPKGLPRNEWRHFLRRHGAPLPGLLAWMPTFRVIRSSVRLWPTPRNRKR